MTQRPYHHGNLRAALVDAGLELTREGGPGALGLREATRRVGVSPNAAYRHFADRDALLGAVAARVQELMADRMALPAGSGAAPSSEADEQARSRLITVGLGYIEFALEEPGWFAVAFFPAPGSAPADSPHRSPATAPPFRMLVEALDTMVTAGVLDPRARPGAEWPCWSAVHGFAELAIHGPLRGLPAAELRALAERTVAAIVTGVQT